MAHFPEELQTLIAHLKKLPGVGSRTAERFAFELLSWSEDDLSALQQTLATLKEKLPSCPTCGCLTHLGACSFCDLSKRDPKTLCILSSPRDAFAIESTHSYNGLYHVIEHLLSPLDGRHATNLRLDRIEERLAKHPIREIIIAFDSTLEGDATALYLKNQLSKPEVRVSRLAFGLPLGSSLEHIDGGTLARSLLGRQSF
jgi:recombination protein RecR